MKKTLKIEGMMCEHCEMHVKKALDSIEGVSWEEAFANCTHIAHAGLNLPVIGKNELIKNKLSTGRLKDMADVESLQKDRKPSKKKPVRGMDL